MSDPAACTPGLPTPDCAKRTWPLGLMLFWLAAALAAAWTFVQGFMAGAPKWEDIVAVAACLLLAVPWWLYRRASGAVWLWVGILSTTGMLAWLFLRLDA